MRRFWDALGTLRFREGASCPCISRLSGMTSEIFTLAFLRCGSMALWIVALLSAFIVTVRLALERLFNTGVRRASTEKELRNAFLILRACDRFSQPQIVTKNLLEAMVVIVLLLPVFVPGGPLPASSLHTARCNADWESPSTFLFGRQLFSYHLTEQLEGFSSCCGWGGITSADAPEGQQKPGSRKHKSAPKEAWMPSGFIDWLDAFGG